MIKELLLLLVLNIIFATTVTITPPSTLVVVQGLGDIVSLNPVETNELSGIQTVSSLYQRVVQPDRNDPTKTTPVLTESWQVDPAAETLIIKLESDAKFASSNPVRPEDVIYFYVRAITLSKSGAFILNVLGWQPEDITSQLKRIDNHTVQVQWSVDINLALALNILFIPIAPTVGERLVAPSAKNNDLGNEWLKMHPAGSGTFKMHTYQPHQAIVMEANANSLTDAPKLKNVVIKNVPDPATRRLLIQQDDVDMARDLGADQIDTLQGGPGVKVMSVTSAEQSYLAFNTGSKDNPPMSNPAFWEAARWLVNYDGITKSLLKGQYFTHRSFLPVGFPGALEETPFTFNPAKAKEIPAKAEIKDPYFTLDVENKPPFITTTQSIQASFTRGGVKVGLLPVAGSRIYSRVRARQYQETIRIWLPDYFDAHSNANSFAHNNGGFGTVAGLNGQKIPELNKETLVAIAEPDSARRLDLYKKMQ